MGESMSAPQDELEIPENTESPEEEPGQGVKVEEEPSAPGRAGQPADAVKKLEAELGELKDKHMRLYAEFENFRKRAAKESFELTATANARLIGKLTEVLDNFNRAFDPKHKGAS